MALNDELTKISFSALLSVYKNDTPQALNTCLESLFLQTTPLEEVIVVQEGEVSTNVFQCLQTWENKFGQRFSWYKLPVQNGPMNYGLPACLNYGITHAKSEYILRVDTDDFNLPTRVAVQKEFALKNPQVKLFGSYIKEFTEDFSEALKERQVPLEHSKIVQKASWLNPFNGPSVVFHTKTAIELGGFPIVPSNEDYCFWALFLKNGHLTANIGQVLVNMRAGEGIIYRRSSKRYIKGEQQALKYLRSIKFFSGTQYYIHVIGKWLIRHLPLKMVQKIYNIFLRK